MRRAALTLSWTTGYTAQRVTRHRAEGDRTLCGIHLSGRRVSAPHLDAEPVHDCKQCQRRRT